MFARLFLGVLVQRTGEVTVPKLHRRPPPCCHQMGHQGVMGTMGLEGRSACADFCFSGLLSGRRRGDQSPQETEDSPQGQCQGRSSRTPVVTQKELQLCGRDSPGNVLWPPILLPCHLAPCTPTHHRGPMGRSVTNQLLNGKRQQDRSASQYVVTAKTATLGKVSQVNSGWAPVLRGVVPLFSISGGP